MIIQGWVFDGRHGITVATSWVHDPKDPWAVVVDFGEQQVTWAFSLELLMEAFTDPSEALHGSGDVVIDLDGDFVFFHLSNGQSAGTVKFVSGDIRKFLSQIDDQGSEELVARELEDFLETL